MPSTSSRSFRWACSWELWFESDSGCSVPLHLSISYRLCKVGFESGNTEGCHSQDERSFRPVFEMEHCVPARVEDQIACLGLFGRRQPVIQVATGVRQRFAGPRF